MTDLRTKSRLAPSGSELGSGSGLRIRPQRPLRAAAGALLVLVTVAVALTLFVRVGDRRDVAALNRTVLAGEQLAASDFKTVSIASDESFPSVSADDVELMVGQYARVRMVAGSLLVAESVQPEPLVDPERVLMSVPVSVSHVPVGLREGSQLMLIVTPASSGSAAPVLVEAMVAAVPGNLVEVLNGDNGASTVALSVEVDPSSAALVGSADAVSVAVLPPGGEFPTITSAMDDDPTATSTPGTGSSVPTITVPSGSDPVPSTTAAASSTTVAGPSTTWTPTTTRAGR